MRLTRCGELVSVGMRNIACVVCRSSPDVDEHELLCGSTSSTYMKVSPAREDAQMCSICLEALQVLAGVEKEVERDRT